MKAVVMSDLFEPVVVEVDPAKPCRRPGRLKSIHPFPIQLLRGEAAEFELEDIRENGLAPATGLAMGVLLSSLIWVVLGVSIWLLLR